MADKRSSRELPAGIRQHRGKYQLRYWGTDGKQHARSFERLSDAKRFQRETETDKDRGDWINPTYAHTPFDHWARTWLASRHKQGAAKRYKNESILNLHVIGDSEHGFGTMPLGRITPMHVQEWVNWMTNRYKPTYVRDAYTILASIMRSAVQSRLIQDAPLSGVELPPVQRKRERFLNEAEVDRLVEGITPYYRALVFTAAWTGCRWGELAGLQRENLDLQHGKLHVRSVLTLDRDQARKLATTVKDYPKSDASRRTIGLPASVVNVIQRHLQEAPASPYVFTSGRGALLRESNFVRRHWDHGVQRAGLVPLTFHDLRHTHVALLIHYGWQEYQIVRRLGWSDGKMLHKVYGHLFPNHDAQLVVELEERLQRSRTTPNVVALRA